MNKIISFLFLSLSFSNCKTDNEENKLESINSADTIVIEKSAIAPLVKADTVIEDESTVAFDPIIEIDYQFVDDEYSAELFSENIIEDFKSKNPSFEYRIVKNEYTENLIDTIFTFDIQSSNIVIYKTREKQIVCSAILRDDIISVSRVQFGMTKEKFGQAFDLSDSTLSNNHIFRVADMMQVQYMDFDFRKGKL
ncbi:hypothetical protein [Reichenbachiella sp.]